MNTTRSLVIAISCSMLLAPSIIAQDLSGYREFSFGMNLLAVANQTGMKLSEAKMLHQRPAMIQELWWYRTLSDSSPPTDPVREFVFSFYNGELFRMFVSHDRYRTEGLTDEDMIQAISAKYGVATRPTAEVVSFSSPQVYNDSEKVLARWEDAEHSFDLFRFAHRPGFGMVLVSKRLDVLARVAIAEAIWLDEQEATQREMKRQKELDEEDWAAQEKAKLVNKPGFCP